MRASIWGLMSVDVIPPGPIAFFNPGQRRRIAVIGSGNKRMLSRREAVPDTLLVLAYVRPPAKEKETSQPLKRKKGS